MQACGLTDRFVRTGIIASTHGQLSVNATRCKEVACSLRSNTLFIEPGAPWEDAYSESFISRMRDELLERELFVNLKEAQVVLEDYRDHYNHCRPHGALGSDTPAEFAAIEALSHQSSGAIEESKELQSVQRLSS